MGNSSDNDVKTKTYKFDRLGTDKFILPDYYVQIDNGKGIIAPPPHALSFGYMNENYASIISAWIDDAQNSLPYDQPGLVIDQLHKSLPEDQGIIEVDNGVTEDGRRYIYFIVKFLIEKDVPAPEIAYHLCMHIECEEKFLSIQAYFEENGVTGMRDSIVLSIMVNQKIIDTDMEGWSVDPYDAEIKNGLLMNMSEQKDYDEMFPEHPLSKCRQMIDFFVKTGAYAGKNSARQSDRHYKKAQIQPKVLAQNIGKIGKSGKEKLQESLSRKSESDEDVDEKEERKRAALDNKLKVAVDGYNAAYTMMNDHGSFLYTQRERSIDVIGHVENLINSIANHPKEFDAEISEITICRQEFKQVCDYARQELDVAQKAAMGVGAGVAGGAAIVSLGPSAAMWVATTFGTASTGTAISALSGAAAESAALAWLGGGAVATGGGGIAGGTAFLALAGPIGWGIAGATLLTSIVLFANKKVKLDKQKKDEIESVLDNTEKVREVDIQIKALLDKTIQLRDSVSDLYGKCLDWYGKDYQSVPEEGKYQLASLVNQARSLALLLGKGV